MVRIQPACSVRHENAKRVVRDQVIQAIWIRLFEVSGQVHENLSQTSMWRIPNSRAFWRWRDLVGAASRPVGDALAFPSVGPKPAPIGIVEQSCRSLANLQRHPIARAARPSTRALLSQPGGGN